MLNQRRAINSGFGMSGIDLPTRDYDISTREKVVIKGIVEDYYNVLNDSEAMIWSHGKLSKRKFDYKGEFIKDDNGHYITEEVVLPHECVAVMSDLKIGVPTKFISKEKFGYVDFVQRKRKDGSKELKYIYIIPRDYCYKLNQTALVLSLTKLRSYYAGSSVALQNGYILYMYVIPYKPTSKRFKNYLIVKTKTSVDYSDEINELVQYWNSRGYLFDYEMCQVYSGLDGRTNVAYESMPDMMGVYERYDPDKSMAKVDDTSDMWGESPLDEESVL